MDKQKILKIVYLIWLAFHKNVINNIPISQPAFTCSKSKIKTLEQDVRYSTHCSSFSIVDYEHVNASRAKVLIKWTIPGKNQFM